MFHNENLQMRSFWVILFAFFTINIAQSFFMMPGLFYILTQTQSIDMQALLDGNLYALIGDSAWNMFLVHGLTTLGGFIITLLIWRFVHKKTMGQLGFRGGMRDLIFGLLLGALSITFIFIILLATGSAVLETPFSTPNFSTAILLYFILYIFVGFFEETFFRGYVIETLSSRGNKQWVIYLVSAILFSAVHGTNPGVSIIGLLNIAIVGVLFAYMYLETNSLWLPIGYHITWNFFQGSVFGFKVSGTNADSLYQMSVEPGKDMLTGGAFGLEGGLIASLVIVLGFFLTRIYVKVFAANDKATQSIDNPYE